MIKKLFKTQNSYNQLVCGSQGVPRIFCNLISDCITKTNKRNETVITFEDVRDAIIDNYTQSVRKKLPDGLELLGAIEMFVLDQKSRFFLISTSDYRKIQGKIEGIVDANAIHQYPSSNVDRRLRNRYKLFMVHYGNFMEALAGANRNNSLEYDKRCDAHLYPKLPSDIYSNPKQYQLVITKEIYEQCFCPKCKKCYITEEISERVCPDCNLRLV